MILYCLELLASLWLLIVGPFNLSVLIRSVVHDREYSLSYTDFLTGLSVFYLINFVYLP